MSENNSDCLIILPIKNYTKENYTKEPGWETLLTQFGKKDICLPDGRRNTIGVCSTLKENALTILVLWNNNVHLDKKSEQKAKLKALLTELYNWFYTEKLINLDNRIVLCGHFHVGMSDVRSIYEDAYGETNDKQLKNTLKEFADPILGRGNFIFESYTIGGEHNRGATLLINELKEMNASSLSEENEKRIPFIFKELFDFFWWKNKLPQLIAKMQGELFMLKHSRGECGQNEFNDSVNELTKCKNILKEQYNLNENFSCIPKNTDTSWRQLSDKDLQEIQDQFDRILLAIVNKRDGRN